MADVKASELAACSSVDAANDLILMVDVSDTSMASSGTTKTVRPNQIGSTTFAASAITSGQVALARSGTGADLSATGGANQFVVQTTTGGALSARVIAASDLPTNDAAAVAS